MKKIAKILFLFAILSVALAACSKEKKIERALIKKDGKWKVTSIDYKYYVNNQLQTSANYPNAGTIEFSKKGSFVMTITLSGSPQNSGGTWTNNKDNITLIANGETTVLRIADGPKKDKMTLEETNYDNSSGGKETLTYYLKRAD